MLPRLLVQLAAVTGIALAHLPFYEPSRHRNVHNKNSTKGGPVAIGPDEDYSFENPFNIVKETAVVVGPPGTPPVPRLDQSMVVETALVGPDDYDVFLYNKTDAKELAFLAYPQVPYCKEYHSFYPSLSLVGPLNTTDTRTNQKLFTAPTETLPFTLPSGYGIKTLHHPAVPANKSRAGFYDMMTSNGWMYPQGWNVSCVEQYNNTGCNWTNAILVHIDTPGKYYWVVWSKDKVANGTVRDVALVTGLTDKFYPADYMRLGYLQPAVAHGRTVSIECAEVPAGLIFFDGKDKPPAAAGASVAHSDDGHKC